MTHQIELDLSLGEVEGSGTEVHQILKHHGKRVGILDLWTRYTHTANHQARQASVLMV